MQYLKRFFKVLSGVGMLILMGCNQGTQNPISSTTTTPAPAAETVAKTEHPAQSQGGQVIETGPYHLELLPVVESEGIHLDFYLQKGDNHQAISEAKVTGQVQSPTGEQSTLAFDYDVAGQHYYALLPEKSVGEYKVVILTEIDGKKVNGRFSFNR